MNTRALAYKYSIVKKGAALIILLYPFILMGQDGDVQFHHLTIEDGLSQASVETIAQDSAGYMWFGTNDGLNRYDGHSFTVYKYSPDDTLSISDNDIRVIYEDRNQTLWVGTQSRGLNRYDRNRDRFIRYIGEPDAWRTLTANTVWALLEDSRGNFWVGTAHGLNLMDRENETFERIFSDPEDSSTLSSNSIRVFYEDDEETLWIGTENGINKYNDDETFTRYLYKSGQNGSDTPTHIIHAIYEDENNTIWVGTEERELYYYNRTDDTFNKFSLGDDSRLRKSINSIEAILEDHKGRLWVGTGNNGLDLYDWENNVVKNFHHNSSNPSSINTDFVTALHQSRDKTIWIGTFNGGINFLEPKPEKFSHFNNEPFNPQSLSNNTVRSIYQDNSDHIWIGTDGGGLNRFDPESRTFEHFNYDPDEPRGLSSDVVLDILETEHGLWIATYGGGVDLIDPGSGELLQNYRNILSDSTSLSSDFVFVMKEISDGKIWFGTNRFGISILDPEKGTFTQLLADINNPHDPITIGNNDVREIFEDHKGDIWIGTYGEILHRYSPDDGLFQKYDINRDNQFFASIAHLVFEDSNLNLWVGTHGGGLFLLDRGEDELRAITTEDGLPSNTIHAIEEDDAGYLWLSTNSGISRFNPHTFEFKNYSMKNGLQNREFSARSSVTDRNGAIYFGGLNGFNRFFPEQVEDDTIVQPLLLTDLLLFNRSIQAGDDSVLDKPIYLKDKLELDYSASVITFEYTTLDYSARNGNQFAYMLEGFETEWNYVGEQRRATYTNLSPGSYTLKVKAANNDGVWDEAGISLPLYITPPFWMTGWFIGAMVLFILLLVATAFHLRVRSVKKTKKKLEKLVADRTKELKIANTTKDKLFSIVSHDLNNVAAGLVGLTDLLKQSMHDDDIESSKEYVRFLDQATGQFVSMLQNLLHWARSQTGRIHYTPKLFRLQTVSLDVLSQEQAKALNKGILLETEMDEKLELYADPDMVALVLRNLVNNALKFTPEGGRVRLEANQIDDQVVIKVRDDGVGMDQETVNSLMSVNVHLSTQGTSNEKGTGLGFSLCQDFVKRNRGTLELQSKKGEGSTVRITFPVKEVEGLSETETHLKEANEKEKRGTMESYFNS